MQAVGELVVVDAIDRASNLRRAGDFRDPTSYVTARRDSGPSKVIVHFWVLWKRLPHYRTAAEEFHGSGNASNSSSHHSYHRVDAIASLVRPGHARTTARFGTGMTEYPACRNMVHYLRAILLIQLTGHYT